MCHRKLVASTLVKRISRVSKVTLIVGNSFNSAGDRRLVEPGVINGIMELQFSAVLSQFQRSDDAITTPYCEI